MIWSQTAPTTASESRQRRWSRGPPADPAAVTHAFAVKTASATISPRNSCAVAAWTTARSSDSHTTRSPPSRPWNDTRASAPTASQRSQRRDSANQVQTARMVVRNPTSIPSSRCPCSASSGVTRHHPGQGLKGS